MRENREYRSDVFSMLMEEPRYALEVYNALNNTDYDDPSLVQMARLDGGISLSIRNDAAFIVRSELNLYEHQSTYNPNMPIRCLFYYAEIMSEIVQDKDLFSHRLIRIPVPHFVVFYNGKEKRPEREVQLLSSAFDKKIEEPEVEVKVTVYNINCNNNMEFLARCEVLRGYMYLVDTVQQYVDEGNELKDAIPKAVDRCIREHVLEEFLRERKGEVTKNMTLDYTWERREKLIRNEEREDGYAAGIADGIEKGIEKGTEDTITATVWKLHSKGMDVATIADMLDMAEQVVEKILA